MDLPVTDIMKEKPYAVPIDNAVSPKRDKFLAFINKYKGTGR